MSKEYKEFENFPPEISVEEFDMIDVFEEKHEFSDKYKRRKDLEMKAYKNRMLGVSRRGIVKMAVAAAIFVIATPLAVNAATDGELFQRLWGNSGKQTIESHEETFVEEEKIDENGNPSETTVTMPKVEYVPADSEKADELIGKNISTEPVTAEVDGTKITVNAITRDGIGIVVEYTIEKEGGVDLLNYSQLDNEAKGAWINEDQPFKYYFGASGKIYVDLEKSTSDKVYCYEYMTSYFDKYNGDDISDTSINLHLIEYTKSPNEIYAENPEANIDDFIKEEKTVSIPFAEKIATTNFVSADGGSLEISPIAMRVQTADSITGEAFEEGMEVIDKISRVEITYKDGSSYLVYKTNILDEDGNEIGDGEEVASYAYLMGCGDSFITLFNRVVDTSNIEKITINNVDYTIQ